MSIQRSLLFGSLHGIPHSGLPDKLRRRLLRIGAEAGIYYAHVWTCVTNIGDPDTDHEVVRIRKAITRTRDEIDLVFGPGTPDKPPFPPRPDELELPFFDPDSCESEEVFDWTSRAAQFVLEASPPSELPAR